MSYLEDLRSEKRMIDFDRRGLLQPRASGDGGKRDGCCRVLTSAL